MLKVPSCHACGAQQKPLYHPSDVGRILSVTTPTIARYRADQWLAPHDWAERGYVYTEESIERCIRNRTDAFGLDRAEEGVTYAESI